MCGGVTVRDFSKFDEAFLLETANYLMLLKLREDGSPLRRFWSNAGGVLRRLRKTYPFVGG
jgi:hypothetical protein